MTVVFKLILFCLIAYIVPFLLGLLVFYHFRIQNHKVSLTLLTGNMLIWGFLQITLIPCIYYKMSLTIFSNIFYSIILLACIISLLLNKHNIKTMIIKKINWLRSKPWLMLVVILLILVQTGYLSLCNLGDHDDAFYVATAETALETDSLMQYDAYTGNEYSSFPSRYVLSPFPLYIALFSKILNIRAATTAHTLLILSLIPLAYMVWYLIGKTLFSENESKTAVFMFIIMCILVYSGYSVYTQGMFMHVRIWQGKATLTAIILPFIFYHGLNIIQNKMPKSNWFILFFTMTASCFASSMGIMLGAIMLGTIAFTDSIIHKSIKNWKNILICCLPNIFYSIIYILIR